MGTLPPRYKPPGGYRGGRGARAAALYWARKRRRGGYVEPPPVLPEGTSQILDNSTWVDASGSKAGGDLVLPAGWGVGFNTLDDVQVYPVDAQNNGIRFLGLAGQRGYLSISIDVTGPDLAPGDLFTFSCYIDEVVAAQTPQWTLTVAGGAGVITQAVRPAAGFTGRIFLVGLVDETAQNVALRMGAGTTAPVGNDFDFSLSRPQVTKGDTLYQYDPQPTPAP
jgi:hypothetical protein